MLVGDRLTVGQRTIRESSGESITSVLQRAPDKAGKGRERTSILENSGSAWELKPHVKYLARLPERGLRDNQANKPTVVVTDLP